MIEFAVHKERGQSESIDFVAVQIGENVFAFSRIDLLVYCEPLRRFAVATTRLVVDFKVGDCWLMCVYDVIDVRTATRVD